MIGKQKKYVFPLYFKIEDSEKLLVAENTLCRKEKQFLIDTRNQSVYIINNSIKDFLIEFREPRSFHNIKTKYGHSNAYNFFRSMIRAEFLVPEDHKINLYYCYPVNPKIRSKYKINHIYKNNQYVMVALAEDRIGNKVVIKHFKYARSKTKFLKFKKEFDLYHKCGEHPNICKLYTYDAVLHTGVLEYIEGKSLKQRIEEKQLNINQKILVAEQIIKTLAHIHNKNIIHGDIHYKQFLIQEDLTVKLIDFGYGYEVDVTPENQISRGGFLYFYDQERVTDIPLKNYRFTKLAPTFSSEIFRIGILLYYIFHETLPFSGNTWKEYIKNLNSGTITFSDKEDISDLWNEIIQRCLKLDDKQQFESCDEILNHLKTSN